MQRLSVTFDRRVELQSLAAGHDCHAVVAQRSADNDRVARLRLVCRKTTSMLDHSHAGGIDIDTVPMAPFDNLGIARDDFDLGLASGLRHGGHDPFQFVDGQSFFQHEGRA